jgi:hypothetical protein
MSYNIVNKTVLKMTIIDGFCHSVWEFRVINCDEVLRKVVLFNCGEVGNF